MLNFISIERQRGKLTVREVLSGAQYSVEPSTRDMVVNMGNCVRLGPSITYNKTHTILADTVEGLPTPAKSLSIEAKVVNKSEECQQVLYDVWCKGMSET